MDAVLDWMHGNVRAGAAKLIFFRVLQPRNGHDSPAGQVLAKSAAITLRQALKVRTCCSATPIALPCCGHHGKHKPALCM